MNKARRKTLSNLFHRLEEVQIEIENLSNVDDIKTQLENVRDAEQEAFDSLPESRQDGDKGAQMTEAVEQMETAIDKLDDVVTAIHEMGENIKEALEAINNATSDGGS